MPRSVATADGVVLMNYDEHYPSPGTAGPVASQDWFIDNLKAASKVIPKDKLISAIGNYGYDWVQETEAWPVAAGSERHERDRAGRMAGGSRLGSGRGFRRRQSQSARQLPRRARSRSTTSGFSTP